MDAFTSPQRQGLYDPANEHDACGVGFVCHIKGHNSHEIVEQGLDEVDGQPVPHSRIAWNDTARLVEACGALPAMS